MSGSERKGVRGGKKRNRGRGWRRVRRKGKRRSGGVIGGVGQRRQAVQAREE